MTKLPNEQLRQDALDQLIQDVMVRMQKNQPVDIESLANEYSHLDPELHKVLPALIAMAQWDPAIDGELEMDELDPLYNIPLGDFQIVRQIGRGGMGVVYKARQLSIARDVALKVLPLAALIDSRSLQRFRNEVNAIATLNHPNIVSVYSVGEERGIHYYAMQLIRGESLATIIGELRSRSQANRPASGESLSQVVLNLEEEPELGFPSSQGPMKTTQAGSTHPVAAETKALASAATIGDRPDQALIKNAVRLIAQTASALQYAHESGVIHRDIKPGNLLLDKTGSIYIADFGLARIENNPGITMTGDVLGTLRYMSPEQVVADQVVDHRTDIYSLGATLYELLTLQPMWPSPNKADVIRQISLEEPVGAHKVNPAIAIDLDTIIRKAVRKDSSERYQTAQALADDLQRFLDNKPIVAKRVTLTQHVSKFLQRHPVAVSVSMLVFLCLAVTMTVATLLVTNAYREEAQARVDEHQARLQAEAKSKLAREVVDDFYSIEATQWIDSQHNLTDRERKLLEKASTLYKVFGEEEPEDPEVQFRVAKANYNVASIERRMGNYENSIGYLQKAEQILVELVALDVSRVGARKILFETQHNLAINFKYIGRFAEAAESMRDAVKTNQTLVEEDADNPKLKFQTALASYGKGSVLFEEGELFDAEFELQTALVLLDQLSGNHSEKNQETKTPDDVMRNSVSKLRVACLNALSAVLEETGQFVESAEFQRQALKLQEGLLEATPDNVEVRFHLAMVRQNYASSLGNLDQMEEALELHRAALKEIEKIVQDYPTSSDFASTLVYSIHGVASTLGSLEQTDEAEKYFLRLFSSQTVFAKDFPEVAAVETGYNSWPLFVAETRMEYGLLLQDASRPEDAAAEFTIAIEVHPTTSDAYYYRADIHRENKQNAKAADDYQAAVKYASQELSEENEGLHRNAELNFMLAASHARLGEWEDANDWFLAANKLVSEISDESSPDPYLEEWQSDVGPLFESHESSIEN